jgi:uncharacterized membrane protein YfcA
VVPFLVALAAVLLLVSPRVRALGEGRRMSGHDGALGPGVTVLVFLCCVYGGYFGAAAGVMILAVLLSRTDRPLPVSNALKNVFLGAANASAAVVFAFRAPVEWAAVPALLIGCILGGWLGPAVIRRVPEPSPGGPSGSPACCSRHGSAGSRTRELGKGCQRAGGALVDVAGAPSGRDL